MHRIKREARNLAWSDPSNPFAKRNWENRPPVINSAVEEGPVPANAQITSRRRRNEPGDVEVTSVHSLPAELPAETPHVTSISHSRTEPALSSESERHKAHPVVEQEAALRLEDDTESTHQSGSTDKHGLRGWLQRATRHRKGETDSNGKTKFTFSNQFYAILEGGTFIYVWKYTPWISLLYLAIPAGFAVNYTQQSPTINFAVNLIAILPSAALLSFAVDEIGLRVGEVLSGLLSATFSNAAQLISSILLLKTRQLSLLQSSLLGAILSNLLFMTGLGFLFGGIGRIEQYFNKTLAQTLCCLLMLAVLSLIIPSAAHYLADMTDADIIMQSRGISVVILISYILWLFFQLFTHKDVFVRAAQLPPTVADDHAEYKQELKKRFRSLVPEKRRRSVEEAASDYEIKEEDDDAKLSLWVAIGATVTSLVLLWFNTDFATNSVQGMLQHAGVSQTFVGVAILPLLSNDWNMPLLARQNRMQMLLELTIEKSMQTALAIIPLVVIIGWGIGIDMTLEFNGFVIAASFAAMVMVSYVVQEGKSNWLVGALLVKVYVIISIAAYFIRD